MDRLRTRRYDEEVDMLSVYVFSLVLGGGFLLVSVLGDALGSDAGDLELDVDVDMDFDVDAGELELDAGDVDVDAGDVDVDADADATHATKIFSIRGLIYTLFGFGAVGTPLTLWGSGGFLSTLLFALLGGGLSGAFVTVLFNWLRATDTGAHRGDTSYVGLPGTVTVPLGPTAAGTVAVERGHRRITLRALPHAGGEGEPSEWRRVVVVEMEDGIARVAPVEDDLALEP